MKRTKSFLILLMAAGMGILTACSNDEEMRWTQQSMEETVTEEAVPEEQTASVESAVQETADSQPDTLMVYVCGAVVSPGVYELESQDRIVDAVAAAGGFLEDAAADYINLASKLQDGIRIMIPTQKQAEEMQQDGQSFLPEPFPQSDQTKAIGEQKVNINTADVTQLCTLSGIGTTRAQSIIAYREEHGSFGRIEEIMNVTGIKEAGFAKIQNQITVK